MLGQSRIVPFSLYAILSICITVVDQYTKGWVMLHCPAHMVCPLFAHFNVTMTTNSGIAFSWFAQSAEVWRTMLLVFSMLIVCCLSVYQWFLNSGQRWARLGVALIIGGALGNIIDKLIMGYVIDFIDFYVGLWHFATFNVADAAISIGACCVLIDTYKAPTKQALAKPFY